MNPRERFEHLLKVISSERFLNKRGLGNEVPFFICPYPADQSVAIETMRANLVNQLTNLGVRVLEINLYDLSISLLRARGIWDTTIAAEADWSKAELYEHLQGVLDPQAHLIPAIGARLLEQDYDVLFLSGVGEVFPFIRSHNVLNNLQSTAKEKPTVLFFPGTYTHGRATGASLDLFGLLHDDKYYRAFDILQYEV
jgi:Fe-S oxidoreductase